MTNTQQATHKKSYRTTPPLPPPVLPSPPLAHLFLSLRPSPSVLLTAVVCPPPVTLFQDGPDVTPCGACHRRLFFHRNRRPPLIEPAAKAAFLDRGCPRRIPYLRFPAISASSPFSSSPSSVCGWLAGADDRGSTSVIIFLRDLPLFSRR